MVLLSLVRKLLPEHEGNSGSSNDPDKGPSSAWVKKTLGRFRIESEPALSDEVKPEQSSSAGLEQENGDDADSDEAKRMSSKTVLQPEDLSNPARQCPLCLSPRGLGKESGGTAVTECGHIFCWTCIHDWGNEGKMECPLCRQALRMERLTPAYNL